MSCRLIAVHSCQPECYQERERHGQLEGSGGRSASHEVWPERRSGGLIILRMFTREGFQTEIST